MSPARTVDGSSLGGSERSALLRVGVNLRAGELPIYLDPDPRDPVWILRPGEYRREFIGHHLAV